MVRDGINKFYEDAAQQKNKRLIRRKRTWAKFNKRISFCKVLGLIISAFTSRELGYLKRHGWVKKVDRPKAFKWSYDFLNKRQPQSLATELYQQQRIENQGYFTETIDLNSEHEYEDHESVTLGEVLFNDERFWFRR